MSMPTRDIQSAYLQQARKDKEEKTISDALDTEIMAAIRAGLSTHAADRAFQLSVLSELIRGLGAEVIAGMRADRDKSALVREVR